MLIGGVQAPVAADAVCDRPSNHSSPCTFLRTSTLLRYEPVHGFQEHGSCAADELEARWRWLGGKRERCRCTSRKRVICTRASSSFPPHVFLASRFSLLNSQLNQHSHPQSQKNDRRELRPNSLSPRLLFFFLRRRTTVPRQLLTQTIVKPTRAPRNATETAAVSGSAHHDSANCLVCCTANSQYRPGRHPKRPSTAFQS